MRIPVLLPMALFAASPAVAAPVSDSQAVAMARPQELIVSPDLKPAARAALLRPVDRFYGFWINGSAKLLAESISPHFIDHTLPAGRPQGPTGPAIASKGFLGAVPDLNMAVVQRIVVGDRVVSHLHFTGHFTGSFNGHAGQGQTVDFIATDILRVRDGRVTDNWHLEDNLTFLQDIGIVPKA